MKHLFWSQYYEAGNQLQEKATSKKQIEAKQHVTNRSLKKWKKKNRQSLSFERQMKMKTGWSKSMGHSKSSSKAGS